MVHIERSTHKFSLFAVITRIVALIQVNEKSTRELTVLGSTLKAVTAEESQQFVRWRAQQVVIAETIRPNFRPRFTWGASIIG